MKELSIEEKAKRYDEAIEYAHYLINERCKEDTDGSFHRSDLQKMFPELKESEDDRIRKELIDFIYDKTDTYELREKSNSWLAWLEKQGETFTKRDVDDAYLKGVTDTKNEIEKQYEANYQIRKDIATFIFNYSGDIKDRAKWMDYLGIKVSLVEKQGEQILANSVKTCKDEQKPADKVELRFKVGDTIKKESTGDIVTISEIDLKNREYRLSNTGFIPFKYEHLWKLVEQKPAWSEEDEERLQSCLNILQAKGLMGVTDTINTKWLKSLKKRVQPKQEWSEEDEKIRTRCAACLGYHYHDDLITKKEYKEAHNWLDSLKDRVQPQPKQEWGEEDERCKNAAINACSQMIENYENSTRWYEDAISWLKSLRPQKHWKPSERLLESLQFIINNPDRMSDYNRSNLIEILEQLKKLREK